MAFTPKHLKLWTLPDSYFGASWPDYYVVYGRHRDSGLLTDSNFDYIVKELGGESGEYDEETHEGGIVVVRENHWAVGWVEWIGVHKSQDAALEKADDLICQLEDYPVLDETDWSNREYEAACKCWELMRVCDRVDWIQRHESSVSIFAARRAELPENLNDISALAE